jgi:arylsulfatase A-like enzyme
MWLWVVVAACIGLAAWFALSRAHTRHAARPRAGAPSFLIIISDALRRDYVGCYGGTEGLTPNIDAFAKRAVRFDNAYAASSWTVPSNAALLTGRYPREVREPGRMRITRAAATMAEYLQAAGYPTAAFSAHLMMSRTYGFDQGFDSFTCKRLQDQEMGARCMKWLSEHRRGGPFFAFLYLLRPHWPYKPERAGAYLVPRRAKVRDLVRQGRIPLDPKVRVPRLVSHPRGDREMSMEEVNYLHASYKGNIVSTDARIGRVLREAAKIPNLVIIVTSDHGEEWLDHRGLSHMYTLYDELLRIPLLMAIPGGRPRVVTAPVSNLDVLPTVLGLAGIKAPRNLRGTNLLPFDKLGPRPLTAEVNGYNPCGVTRYSVRIGDETLICNLTGLSDEPTAPPGGRFQRYDFVRDPREQHPLPVGDRNHDALWRVMQASNPFTPQAMARAKRLRLDEKTRKDLETTGYIK